MKLVSKIKNTFKKFSHEFPHFSKLTYAGGVILSLGVATAAFAPFVFPLNALQAGIALTGIAGGLIFGPAAVIAEIKDRKKEAWKNNAGQVVFSTARDKRVLKSIELEVGALNKGSCDIESFKKETCLLERFSAVSSRCKILNEELEPIAQSFQFVHQPSKRIAL